ncbi:MAG TPA: hypothetical protein VL137_13250 [Polyangiaceae bacterium]|nr:hypothetical protein [Polyangiaceae bacterium]
MIDHTKCSLALVEHNSTVPPASGPRPIEHGTKQIVEIQDLLRNLFDHVLKVQQLRDRMPTLRPTADPDLRSSKKLSLYDLRRSL